MTPPWQSTRRQAVLVGGRGTLDEAVHNLRDPVARSRKARRAGPWSKMILKNQVDFVSIELVI